MPKLLTHFPQPEFFYVADKPLSQNGVAEPLNAEQIKTRFGLDYCENIVAEDTTSETLPGNDPKQLERCELINHWLHMKPQALFAVCKINDEVGYGVFTRVAVKAGTIVGLYSGLREKNSPVDKRYAMKLVDSPYRVDAAQIGGITRFIQHLPFSLDDLCATIESADKDELVAIADVQFFPIDESSKSRLHEPQILAGVKQSLIQLIRNDAEVKQRNTEYNEKLFLQQQKMASITAFANVQPYCIQLNGQFVLVLQAARNIKAHEQLGITYGHDYWIAKKAIPAYFNKVGEVIPKSFYLPPLNDICQKYKKPNETFLPDINLAFRNAAFNGNNDDLLCLLEYGADINSQGKDTGRSALHQAARKPENIRTILLLLSRDINEGLRDTQGKLAIEYENYPDVGNMSAINPFNIHS